LFDQTSAVQLHVESIVRNIVGANDENNIVDNANVVDFNDTNNG